jgi:sugar-specific transcriptional regulator TrmB
VNKLSKQALGLLKKLGLTSPEMRVYIYLSRQGPCRARTLTFALRFTKQQLYPCLRSMQEKQCVFASKDHPSIFTAIPFADLVDLSVVRQIKDAIKREENKKKLLDSWEAEIMGNR